MTTDEANPETIQTTDQHIIREENKKNSLQKIYNEQHFVLNMTSITSLTWIMTQLLGIL